MLTNTRRFHNLRIENTATGLRKSMMRKKRKFQWKGMTHHLKGRVGGKTATTRRKRSKKRKKRDIRGTKRKGRDVRSTKTMTPLDCQAFLRLETNCSIHRKMFWTQRALLMLSPSFSAERMMMMEQICSSRQQRFWVVLSPRKI